MRVREVITSLFAVAVLVAPSAVRAETLEKELATLKEKIGKQLVAKDRKKVAALDFTDLQGRRNELGRYLAEQLTVELVGADGISVVDRANLKSILDEHKLSEEGLVKPENAKKLGEFAGVDAIIIGTVSVGGTDVELLVKAISTDTAEVVAAGRMKFAKTSELQQLLSKSVGSSSPTAEVAGAGGAAAGTGLEALPAIVTKDIGRLRIALTNITPVGQRDTVTGLVCSFQLTNLDLQKTLKVAQNAALAGGRNQFRRRSKISDSAGQEWRLAEVAGLPMVACPNPDSIVRSIKSGKQISPQDLWDDDSTWMGDFVLVEPGGTTRVSMTYRALDEHGRSQFRDLKSINAFQLESELVIGACDVGSDKAEWKLEALVLDRVTMPTAGQSMSVDVKP